ncbi:MAG: type II secretion system protein [Planctomycetes bacterium]|nr:type II secretion system protein [Planctomycetota bacterium]
MRRGYTMLEIMIALAIFGLVASMAFDGLFGVRRYADLSRAQDLLEIEGKRAIDVIGNELANSAWTPATQPATNFTTFPRVWKADDPIRLNAPPPSFPFGETLSYYKLRTEATIAAGSPLQLQVEHIPFDNFAPGNVPVAMADFARARPITSLVLNGNWSMPATGDPPPVVSVAWESSQAFDASSVGIGDVNYLANLDLGNLRRYRFTVIPDANSGTGILVRQWHNDGSDLDTDWLEAPVIGSNAVVVVRNVIDIGFETYLTEADTAATRLNPNQVRITLTLGRAAMPGGTVVVSGNTATDGLGGVAILRRFSAIISLRSITDPTE